jgi:hypothetical protein
MKTSRVLSLIGAFCIVIGIVVSNSYGQVKSGGRGQSRKIHEKTTAEWSFWYEAVDGSLHDETFSDQKSCKSAQKSWSKDRANGAIIFRCAQLTPKLLKKAKNKCSSNQEHGCDWQSMIQTYLDSR